MNVWLYEYFVLEMAKLINYIQYRKTPRECSAPDFLSMMFLGWVYLHVGWQDQVTRQKQKEI